MATVLRAKSTWVRAILVPLPLLRYKKRKTVNEFCFARYLQPRGDFSCPEPVLALGSQGGGAGWHWVGFQRVANFFCRGDWWFCVWLPRSRSAARIVQKPRQWALQSARNVRRNALCPVIVVVFYNPWQLRARACACLHLAGRVLIPCRNREPSAPTPLM